jgi:membrane protein required for colicin V production
VQPYAADTDDFSDEKPDWLTKATPEQTAIDLMNSFDAAVYLALLIAIVTGFNTGLLRSAVTILAYFVAMPIALAAMAYLTPQIAGKFDSPLAQNSVLFFVVFLISGMVLGKCARMALDETIGSDAGIVDRFGGAALGAARVGLVAITLVLIFDQLVPIDHQPAFLTGSQLRPLLSAAGQKGFRSLPPDVTATIDRLKREHHI